MSEWVGTSRAGRRRRRRLALHWIGALVLLLVCSPARGAADVGIGVSVGFPLEGYYRPGRYMPVGITMDDAGGGPIELKADGALPTTLAAGGPGRVVVPWLPLLATVRNAGIARAGHPAQPVDVALHALSADQRLIGTTLDGAAPSAALFPGKSVLVVRLDGADPLAGPAIAWQTLDGVVLDRAGFDRVVRSSVDTLLSAGVTLAVQSDEPPDRRHAWQRKHDMWVLGRDLLGPAGAEFADDAYAPTYSWAPGWAPAMRRGIAMAAAALALLVLLLSIWRSRWATVAIILVCIVATATLIAVRHRTPPVFQAGGRIIVEPEASEAVQSDTWLYQAARQPVGAGLHFAGATWPVFASAAHARQLAMRLECGADGQPIALSYQLPANGRCAFLSRRLTEPSGAAATADQMSPLLPLAQSLYVRPGWRVNGAAAIPRDLPADITGWPSVILQRVWER